MDEPKQSHSIPAQTNSQSQSTTSFPPARETQHSTPTAPQPTASTMWNITVSESDSAPFNPSATADRLQESTPAVITQQNRPLPAAMLSNLDEKQDTVMGGGSQANNNNSTPTPVPQVRAGGAPVRVYLNEKVIPHVLEGVKGLAKDQPPNPLRVLGEYLIQKSNELENGTGDQQSH